MTDRYIHVVGWDRFQHYKERDPPWIKNYKALLSKDEYLDLSFHLRGLLHSLWLAYATSGRQLRDNTATLHRQLGQRVLTRDLERLRDAGFITFAASKTLSQRERQTSVEEEPLPPPLPQPAKPPRKKRAPDELWDTLVEIVGASPNEIERGRWNKALGAMRESGATPDTLRKAAKAYRAHPTFAECAMTPLALASNWAVLTANGSNGQASPYEQARTWVRAVGWQYPDHDLFEELSKRGMEGDQRKRLAELALELQGAA